MSSDAKVEIVGACWECMQPIKKDADHMLFRIRDEPDCVCMHQACYSSKIKKAEQINKNHGHDIVHGLSQSDPRDQISYTYNKRE